MHAMHTCNGKQFTLLHEITIVMGMVTSYKEKGLNFSLNIRVDMCVKKRYGLKNLTATVVS